jgi:spoIIIJ-associated protein
MATASYEFTGKTVDDAVAEGLRALRVSADQVEVEVISRGSRGIFGLGSEPAQVRLHLRLPPATPVQPPQPATPEPAPTPTTVSAPPSTVTTAPVEAAAPIPAPPAPVEAEPAAQAEVTQPPVISAGEQTADLPAEEPATDGAAGNETSLGDGEVETIAVDLLTQTVRHMGFQATVHTEWREGNDELSEHDDRYLLLDVQGDELGALIGRRGETLDNLQYVLRLMVNQRLHRWQNIVVDVEGYKERRIHQLTQLAQRTATQVAATGRAVSLEPMPPNERRIIHLTLRDHPDVYTESIGEGDRRKVQILTKH